MHVRKNRAWMPRACPVESHAYYYPGKNNRRSDATGLSRGGSRLLLSRQKYRRLDATGLSRGGSRLLLSRQKYRRLDATGLSRGGSRSQLCSLKRETPRDKPVASSI